MDKAPVLVLIHPNTDRDLLAQATAILEQAVIDHPDTFDHVAGVPATIDHYGYHDDMRSSVVLGAEAGISQYHRLTIRPGLHPVFDQLGALIRDRLTP